MKKKQVADMVGKTVGPGPEDTFRRAEARAMSELSRIHMDDQRGFLNIALTSQFSCVRVQAAQNVMDPKLIPVLQFASNSDVRTLGRYKTESLASKPVSITVSGGSSELEQAGMDQHKLLDIALSSKDERTRVMAAQGIFQPDMIPRLMASECGAVREIAQRKLAGRK